MAPVVEFVVEVETGPEAVGFGEMIVRTKVAANTFDS